VTFVISTADNRCRGLVYTAVFDYLIRGSGLSRLYHPTAAPCHDGALSVLTALLCALTVSGRRCNAQPAKLPSLAKETPDGRETRPLPRPRGTTGVLAGAAAASAA